MRKVIIYPIRFTWRLLFLPIIKALPKKQEVKILTYFQSIKMKGLQGKVVAFDHGVITEAEPIMDKNDVAILIVPVESESTPLIPDWIVDELRSLSEIEPNLYPTPDFLARYVQYAAPMELEPGIAYKACCSIIADLQPDIIFLIPWLVPGGADKGVLHHVDAALAFGMNVLVISTLDHESPWKNRLPQQVKFVELGKIGGHLTEDQKLNVLTRLVLQSPAKVIHNINSGLGWEMLKQYNRQLSTYDKRVFASLFCDDYDHNGALRSYAQMYLVDCWPFLQGIMCDTRWYPNDLKRQYGVSLDKINTVYFPVHIDATPLYKSFSVPRVLWAGRFAQQKRVDLLIEIAQLLPEITFDVYGYAVHESELEQEASLRKLTNVNVYGAFESISALIEANEYALFLYTSGWEGLPLTLLEVTIAGLPMVASPVGGVPEFISEITGYPVTDVNNPEAYVTRIRDALDNEQERSRKWDAAVDLLLSRHTTEYFTQQLESINNYLMGDTCDN